MIPECQIVRKCFLNLVSKGKTVLGDLKILSISRLPTNNSQLHLIKDLNVTSPLTFGCYGPNRWPWQPNILTHPCVFYQEGTRLFLVLQHSIRLGERPITTRLDTQQWHWWVIKWCRAALSNWWSVIFQPSLQLSFFEGATCTSSWKKTWTTQL